MRRAGLRRIQGSRQKTLLLSLREHIGHAFDKMKVTDWIDVIAAIGITPVIRQAVITSESFMKATGASIAFIGQIPKEVWGVFLMPLPTDKNYGSDFTSWLLGNSNPSLIWARLSDSQPEQVRSKERRHNRRTQHPCSVTFSCGLKLSLSLG